MFRGGAARLLEYYCTTTSNMEINSQYHTNAGAAAPPRTAHAATAHAATVGAPSSHPGSAYFAAPRHCCALLILGRP
eukprot:SAG31_NODE_3937_length_3736_cov_1.195766_1_plen_77_part_00